jgi:hypothetical protein
VIKGPDPRLVFTEYAAYELAGRIGVPVPEHALCTSPVDGAVYFASRRLDFRFPPEAVLKTGRAENPEMLADTAAFDIWVVNNDRNLNNLVAGPSEDPDKVRLYAIDFEGAEGLRGVRDLFSLTAVDTRTLLPHEELRAKCCRYPLPVRACDHIADSRDAIEPIAAEWLADMGLPRLDWCERAASVLSSRADRIHTLVRDAWR